MLKKYKLNFPISLPKRPIACFGLRHQNASLDHVDTLMSFTSLTTLSLLSLFRCGEASEVRQLLLPQSCLVLTLDFSSLGCISVSALHSLLWTAENLESITISDVESLLIVSVQVVHPYIKISLLTVLQTRILAILNFNLETSIL